MKYLFACAIVVFMCVGCSTDDDDDNATVNGQDTYFMQQASYSNYAEVNAGAIAAVKGSYDSIRMFGSMMVSDHGGAQNELDSLAGAFGVTVPSAPDSVRNHFEKKVMGEIDVLIHDGVLNVGTMQHTRVTREKLFAELRGNSIKHLGEVQRFYFEASGEFALVKAKQPFPGLSVIPNWDKKMRDKQKPQPEISACKTCGNVKQVAKEEKVPCNNCGSTDTEYAVL